MKNVIKLVVLLVFSCFSIVYAETNEITSDVSVTEQTVTISGQISHISGGHQVTLLVGSTENIIYIDQVKTKSNGVFKFVFSMPDDLPSGLYEYTIGSDADTLIHSGTINYVAPIKTEERIFIEAYIDVTISGYRPIISGTVSCIEGKTAEIIIRNITDNTVISNELITSDGVFDISYTLPSLLDTKEYEVSIVCRENDIELESLIFSINSSTMLVDIKGSESSDRNVSINAQLQSFKADSTERNVSFTGNKSISLIIPDILLSERIHLYAEGNETVVIGQQPAEQYSTYTFNGESNDEILVMAKGENITTFEGKTYEITYDENKLMPIGLYKSSFQNALGIKKNGGVEIVSNETGKIKFKMEDVQIPNNKYWNGVMHIFKFRNIFEEAITTDIQFKKLQ